MSEGRVPEIEPPGAEGTTPKDSSGMREPLPGGSGTTTSSSSSSSSSSGCGCVPMGPAVAGIPDPSITVSITPTTGGQFDITVDRNESVENLKKIISKRLKVAKERICLLHRERQLRDGTLQENQLQDGSRLTLLPSVETGLLAQRPEQSVMQALESLSDSQVNDFLSGKAPLNLTMRLGDHMMLIQLQLSTVTPATSSTATSTTTLANSSSQIQPTPAPRSQQQQPQQQPQPQQHSAQAQAHAPAAAAAAVHHQLATQQALAAQLNQELLNARMAAAPSMDASRRSSGYSSLPSTPTTPNCPPKLSLSSSVVNNLASSSSLFATPSPSPPNTPTSPISPCCTVSPCLPPVPLQSQQQQQPNQQTLSNSSSSSSSSSSRHPPPPPLNLHQQQKKHVSASSRHRMLTCLGRLPYHHHHHHHHHHHYHHHHRNLHRFARKMGLANKSSSCPSCPETEAMVDTSEPSLSSSSAVASAAAVASANKCPDYSSNSSQCSECAKSPKKKMCCCPPECSGVPASTTTTSSQQQAIASPSADGCAAAAAAMTTTTTTTVSAPPTPTTPTTPTSPEGLDTTTTNETTTANPTATLDTRALVEASRNLTQKLKQLSYEENAKRRQGAIIESMHHHGKGVYTGTFSGTLNPALQDRHGRPKRDISTIIHILNDLLCATPASSAGHLKVHYRNPNRASASSSASTTGAISGPQSSSMFSISSGGPSSSSNMQTDHAASSPSSPNLACPSEELSKENEATKGKMRKLRLVMEQRREKMRARRQARAAPYTTNFAAVTPDPEPDASSTSSSTNGSGSKSAGDSPNEPELSPCSSEPVVA